MAESQLQYQVLITPLISKNAYGDEIDVTQDIDISEFVSEKGIGKIKTQIDNGDYEFGIFTFSDIKLTLINYDGRFNDESDPISIFPYRRDLAKVTVNFIDTDGTTTISFDGLVNDEGTRQDYNKGLVKLKVLSRSSIFKKTKVPAGIITNGTLFSDAIKNILNITDITSVLTYDASKINVGLDLEIDDGSKFDNRTVKDALNDLLVVSSSILYVDSTNTMIVSNRTEDTSTPLHNFFGGNDIFGRENILSLKKFNNGLHRMFNSLVINGTITEDLISVNRLGIRQKSLSFDFITDSTKYLPIGNAILDDFKNQRPEMEIMVRTENADTIKLLDLVTVDVTSVSKPAEGMDYFPLYGISEYGSDNYPLVVSPLPIRSNDLFKVIGIFEDPKNFTTTLKLRATGNALAGSTETLPLYGTAKYGQNEYQTL
jgi:hypothetical protein